MLNYRVVSYMYLKICRKHYMYLEIVLFRNSFCYNIAVVHNIHCRTLYSRRALCYNVQFEINWWSNSCLIVLMERVVKWFIEINWWSNVSVINVSRWCVRVHVCEGVVYGYSTCTGWARYYWTLNFVVAAKSLLSTSAYSRYFNTVCTQL